MHYVQFFNACWRQSVKPLQFYCSLYISVLVYRRRILFWLKMVCSDNVILHTLAGCVVALLDKYSPIDSHCELSMLSSCVVKRWFWLYFSNLCDLSSGQSIHWLYVLFVLLLLLLLFFSFVYLLFIQATCPVKTLRGIRVVGLCHFYWRTSFYFVYFLFLCFVYFIITAALCVLINGRIALDKQ